MRAAEQLVWLRAALNNGSLERADCDLPTVELLRKIQRVIRALDYGGNRDNPDQICGPLFLPGEIISLGLRIPPAVPGEVAPLWTSMDCTQRIRKADDPFDPFEGLGPPAESIPELQKSLAVLENDGEIGELAMRALRRTIKPELTTKRKRWVEFLRELRALSAELALPKVSPGVKVKRPGRKKADYETQQREAELAADWKRARDAGTHKADFAKQKGLKVKDLDALLDRVAWRNRPTE